MQHHLKKIDSYVEVSQRFMPIMVKIILNSTGIQLSGVSIILKLNAVSTALNYETIGSVNQAAVQGTGQFNFRDHFRTVTGLNNDFFYRLKEVEANGNIIYSKVLIARMFNTTKPGFPQCNTRSTGQ